VNLGLQFLLFAVGLVSVTLGADWLVTGASRVAAQRGVSPLILGLTIVAFGTSAPELVVSGAASFRAQPGIAVGNIMGANVGLIVGIGALVRPIKVHRRLLRREAPLMVLVLAVVMALAWNGAAGRLDGIALIVGFSLYLWKLLAWAKSDTKPLHTSLEEAEAKADPRGRRPWLNWLVDSAVHIARHFDVSEAVIGATLVAVGTSMPELASTVAAAVRGLGDIAIGNVIGSNIFNLGLVMGTASIIKPLPLPAATVLTEMVPALIFCLALIPLALTGSKVSRGEGALLLVGYGFFVYSIL
jgi:cation:H+ antiporter